MSSVPTSIPEPGLGAKLSALWLTNKPVFIAIIAGITLLVLGIVFLILWFTVIKPHQNGTSGSATTPVASNTTN